MTIPVTNNGSAELASRLLNSLKAAHAACLRAQTEVASDNYGSIINIPSNNKALQDAVTAVTNSGDVNRVISQLNDILPSDVTIVDVQAFTTAYNNFAADIETNAGLFLVSINATNKRPEFVTPVAQGVKDTINTRITAVLAEVS
jgi:hypothetical protein